MKATTKVLGTVELLEIILLHLPVYDIIFAEGVCKEWKTSIQNSPSISEALFRKTGACETVKLKYRFGDSKRGENPRGVAEVFWMTASGKKLTKPPVFNPFFNRYRVFKAEGPGEVINDLKYREVKNDDDERFNDHFANRPYGPEYGEIGTFNSRGSLIIRHKGLIDPLCYADAEQIAPCEAAVHHKGASCQAMLVSQPAISEMQFVCHTHVYDDYFVTDKNGIKMGELMRALKGHWAICPNCPVWWGETNRWTFNIHRGEEEHTNLGTVSDKLTGWEMLEVLDRAKGD